MNCCKRITCSEFSIVSILVVLATLYFGFLTFVLHWGNSFLRNLIKEDHNPVSRLGIRYSVSDDLVSQLTSTRGKSFISKIPSTSNLHKSTSKTETKKFRTSNPQGTVDTLRFSTSQLKKSKTTYPHTSWNNRKINTQISHKTSLFLTQNSTISNRENSHLFGLKKSSTTRSMELSNLDTQTLSTFLKNKSNTYYNSKTSSDINKIGVTFGKNFSKFKAWTLSTPYSKKSSTSQSQRSKKSSTSQSDISKKSSTSQSQRSKKSSTTLSQRSKKSSKSQSKRSKKSNITLSQRSKKSSTTQSQRSKKSGTSISQRSKKSGTTGLQKSTTFNTLISSTILSQKLSNSETQSIKKPSLVGIKSSTSKKSKLNSRKANLSATQLSSTSNPKKSIKSVSKLGTKAIGRSNYTFVKANIFCLKHPKVKPRFGSSTVTKCQKMCDKERTCKAIWYVRNWSIKCYLSKIKICPAKSMKKMNGVFLYWKN